MFQRISSTFFHALSLTIGIFAAGISSASGFSTELVEANPDAGFNYPYVLRVPESLNQGGDTVLLIESNNTGSNDDFQAQIDAAITFANGNGVGAFVAGQLDIPLLVPVFPRTKTDWQFYTHALDRDTMLVEEGPLRRLDTQLVKMIDDARAKLASRNINTREKFLICGFSASGTFSNRFAFLHPERILAVASGAVNAFPMLPVSKHTNQLLNYPLGLNDFYVLTGGHFNAQAWQSVPQMIFMGSLDSNDAVEFSDAYSDAEREAIYSTVGRPMQLRWSNVQAIYLDSGANVTFVTYGQVGHWTDGRINRDVANFLRSALR